MVSVRAIFSRRSRISSAVFLSTLARSYAVSFIHVFMASAAAPMARRQSSRVPLDTSAMISSVAGFSTPIFFPDDESTHWPSM